MGEKSNIHRCHKLPFDTKLRKKKKFKKPKEIPRILGRKNCEDYHEKMKKDSESTVDVKNISEKQKDELCRGKEIRPPLV